MKIAICTHNKATLTSLYQILWDSIDCQIDTYTNSSELLDTCKRGLHYPIIFCDSLASPLSGVELGRSIQSLSKETYLILFNSHIEYALSGYEVGAYRFLLTPFSCETIKTLLLSIQNDIYHSSKLFLNTSIGKILMNLNDITYLEAADKDTWIYTKQDTFCISKGLIDFETILPQSIFHRIHRKYLVNLKHVTEFDASRVTLDTGTTLLLSRRRSHSFSLAIKHLYSSITC